MVFPSPITNGPTFYEQALAPLGYRVVQEVAESSGSRTCGFGESGTPDFWIAGDGKTGPALHVVFQARDQESVNVFYAAALRAGGKDNGAPGTRAHYHPNYYAAFVLDSDGHNIEAVCHSPGTPADQRTF